MSEPAVLLAEATPGPARVAASAATGTAAASGTVRELQERIKQMQSTRLSTRSLQTVPALAPLLPGGALQAGASYSVEGSHALLMALMAGPSAAGAWCAVVGIPDFGAEAAARAGVELDRLVLVPHPGDQWLAVASAVIDVVTVVVTATPPRLSGAVAARLAARIRQREATLIVLGSWAASEATLRITESTWGGIGQGHGHLASRQVLVSSAGKGFSGQKRQTRLWLPDAREQVRLVNPGFGAGAEGGWAQTDLADEWAAFAPEKLAG
ncbi:hypothetical protein [Subtercola lobariae]|uniref:hypothetical protein n=1 Tax=Subtercola lobariae TaxID=1588641 RepID=UPI00166DD6D4|nr:hypothetical protein [Subtercola lobariae]